MLSIYRELVHRHPEVKGTPTVAVISPYKAQVRLYCIPIRGSYTTKVAMVATTALCLPLRWHSCERLLGGR